jgi:hypothetical protein
MLGHAGPARLLDFRLPNRYMGGLSGQGYGV